MLVTRVIAPTLGAADPQPAERWVRHLDAILRRQPTLNSHTPWTAMWVEALEALMLRAGLSGLTLLRWREVLPYKGLLRSVRAWCPACLAGWAASGVPHTSHCCGSSRSSRRVPSTGSHSKSPAPTWRAAAVHPF